MPSFAETAMHGISLMLFRIIPASPTQVVGVRVGEPSRIFRRTEDRGVKVVPDLGRYFENFNHTARRPWTPVQVPLEIDRDRRHAGALSHRRRRVLRTRWSPPQASPLQGRLHGAKVDLQPGRNAAPAATMARAEWIPTRPDPYWNIAEISDSQERVRAQKDLSA